MRINIEAGRVLDASKLHVESLTASPARCLICSPTCSVLSDAAGLSPFSDERKDVQG